LSRFLDRFDTEDVLLQPRGGALLLLVLASFVEELEVVVVMIVSSSQGYLPSAVMGCK